MLKLTEKIYINLILFTKKMRLTCFDLKSSIKPPSTGTINWVPSESCNITIEEWCLIRVNNAFECKSICKMLTLLSRNGCLDIATSPWILVSNSDVERRRLNDQKTEDWTSNRDDYWLPRIQWQRRRNYSKFFTSFCPYRVFNVSIFAEVRRIELEFIGFLFDIFTNTMATSTATASNPLNKPEKEKQLNFMVINYCVH